MIRRLAPTALVALAFASACAGPPVPAPVEDLPVCPDFVVGHTKMEGSLRHPVRLRVLDGKTQVSKIVISGLRKPDDPKPRTFIADDNAEYNIEWAQCGNERAPRSVADVAHDTGKGKDKQRESDTAYDCGDATVYKTEKLVTKKGDKGSHTVHFAVPPNPACWVSDAAATAPQKQGAADAGAPEPAAADAGATDAGAAAPDAGGPTGDAGTAAPAADAGPVGTDAGAKR
jgi:hypothetical protein